MPSPPRAAVINDFLASAHILSSTVDERMEHQLREEVGGRLTRVQLRVLTLVANTPTTTISEVASFLGVSRPAASKSVGRLVSRGLVERRESPEDRRSQSITLSSKGRALMQTYEQARFDMLGEMFAEFPPEDFERTTRLLDRLSLDLVGESGDTEKLCFRCGIYFRKSCLLRQRMQDRCYYHDQDRRERGATALADTGSEETGS